MPRAAIFIDGAYVDFMLRDQFAATRIDYGKLALLMAGGMELLRTYYYHCPPYQAHPPTEEERDRKAKFDKFEASLRAQPRFDVRLGKLEYRGVDGNGKRRFEQKRVDILLGVDLTRLAAKSQITDAILLAGDSDFLPAIQAAKDDGVLIRLFHGNAAHRDLISVADERTVIDATIIEKIRRV